LKQSKYIFILLYIYTSIFPGINAQEISLSIKAEIPISKSLQDSLQIPPSFQNFTSLQKKTDTIYRTFLRMGFIENELIELRKENGSSYTAEFFLGKRYREIKIFYSQDDFDIKETNRVSSKATESYFTIPLEAIPSVMEKLTAFRNQKGNAFARLKLTEIEKDSTNELRATLFLEKGNARTIDSIVIKGYENFPRSYIKYYAGVKKGEIFDQKKLIAQNENLNSLGFVSSSKPPEALFRKDSTSVYFYLEKENNNLFDGILGFATDEETQKLEFNGYLNLELNNNFNYGEQLLLNYKADGKEQINFRTKINLPYLFKTRFGLGGELKIFKRDSSFVTTEQQIRATYQINPSSQTYVGYRGFVSSNLLDEIIAGIPIENFKSKFLIFGGTYIKPQNKKIFPIKTFLSLDLGFGNREREGYLDDQFKLESTLNNIFRLDSKNSIFVQSTTAALLSDTFLLNELFRFGGINSIRGFDENSIDASLFSVLNTEYRHQFNETVFAHTIIDLGYFENATLELKKNLYSFGFGFGLTTKAGLFRFIVANGSTEDQNFEFANSKIHISVSSRF
jgi:outer membrane protein assembly factor BamA